MACPKGPGRRVESARVEMQGLRMGEEHKQHTEVSSEGIQDLESSWVVTADTISRVLHDPAQPNSQFPRKTQFSESNGKASTAVVNVECCWRWRRGHMFGSWPFGVVFVLTGAQV